MSEDTRAIVAAILAAASGGTRDFEAVLTSYELILDRLQGAEALGAVPSVEELARELSGAPAIARDAGQAD